MGARWQTHRERERSARRSARRVLGLHDRWSNPLLAGMPRRCARALANDSAWWGRWSSGRLKRLYSADHISRLVYADSPLLAMIKKPDSFGQGVRSVP